MGKLRPGTLRLHRKLVNGDRLATLTAEGWTEREAKKLLEGWKGHSIAATPFKAMRKSRIDWWNGLLRLGWTTAQIIAAIESYYDKQEKFDPWRLFRAEYEPEAPKPKRNVGDYRAAMRRHKEAKKEVKKLYHPKRKPKIAVQA